VIGNCSRGATQCLPATFATCHQVGTATTPYDVVACMCATVDHVRHRCRVNLSGSNFTTVPEEQGHAVALDLSSDGVLSR
jgi:hypothetical protein